MLLYRILSYVEDEITINCNGRCWGHLFMMLADVCQGVVDEMATVADVVASALNYVWHMLCQGVVDGIAILYESGLF